MTYGQAVIYGVVQGFTEFLPISSSGHLVLLPRFMNVEDPGLTFDVFLHLGTLLAILIYFWRDWKAIVLTAIPVRWRAISLLRASSSNLKPPVPLKWLIVSTIPALLVGAAFHSSIKTIFRGPAVISMTLILGGVILYLADQFSSKAKKIGEIQFREALWVGIAQCFALMPGVSRSGATITGGRLLGLDRGEAARYSFLISLPVTGAAVVFEMRHYDQLFHSSLEAGPVLVAFAVSFFSGMLAIGFLLSLLKRFGFFSFALYRMILGWIVILTVV